MAVWPGAARLLSGGAVPAGQEIDAEQRFRALLESAPDAMVIVDGAGTIRLVNAQTEALFGYPREELLGCPVEILVPGRLRGDHPVHRRGYAANQQVRPMGAGLELSGLRRDGSEFPVEISLSPLETSDGVITFWNAAAARMYGYTAEEAIGRHVSILAPPGHEDEIDALLARIGRGERIDHYETLRLTSTGSLLDVDTLLCPVRARDGAITGACAIARDITGLKRAQQEITRLYEQQRHIALTLQRALMGSPPEVPGVQTASRYLPATRGAGVGGDWFDLIPLGAGRVGVLIGDVMGRGLEAATVMGQLRSAARALAKTQLPPQQLMHALDAVARDLPGQLITCCYLVINANQGELTAASAGHLPVLLVQPDATIGQLPVPVSVPLGVGGIPHQETTVPVPPCSTLVLYTDGLVETRTSDLGTQIKALETALRTIFATTSSLEEAADRVLAALLPGSGEPADDVTLLLARTPAAPLASAQTMLRPEPRQVAAGRRFARQTLTAWQQTGLADTVCLLVSEILTNAVHHARQMIGLHLHYTAREVIAEITDDNPQLPQRTLPAPADESGRGSWQRALGQLGVVVGDL